MVDVCQVTGGAGGVDEEVKRVQAECRYLSAEIQRLREDNSKLRVGYLLTTSDTHCTASILSFLSNFSHALVFCCCNFSFSKTYKQQFSNAVTFCHSHSNVVISAALVILCYLKTQDYCHTYIVIPVALSQTPGCVAIAVDGVPSFCLAVEGWPG